MQMAPHLVDGQVVFLAPGTFGSYVMARIVREAGNHADVAWAETGTLPYLARKHGEREVNVTVRAVRLPTGVYPARREAEQALAVIRAAYPSVHGCGDALSGALMNAGPVIHPPLMVMNAAPLQHFERWDIHNEGTQPAVRAVTDRLDQERIAVREALGYAAPHYPLADHYNNDRWMYGDAHKKLVKSGDWREAHRPAHPPLRHRGHRARPGVPGVGGALDAASTRRSPTACWPSSAAFSGATCATARARSKRWAWPARSRDALRSAAARGRVDAMAALCRRRRRSHGAWHRDRLRLRRPPHRAGRPASSARREAWQRLCDEARDEIRASLGVLAQLGALRAGAGRRHRRAGRAGRRARRAGGDRGGRTGLRGRARNDGSQARRLRADQSPLHATTPS